VSDKVGTAIYLVGHGSKTKPRLIELQHQRILRYRQALLSRHEINKAAPSVFTDIRLPPYGLGHVTLEDVPRFLDLYEDVKYGRIDTVFIDLDETRQELRPGYESSFVRTMVEEAGATVLNAYWDDRGAFVEELKARYGQKARPHEVTDESDFVCFFPSLTADICTAGLRKEIEVEAGLKAVRDRIQDLRESSPYRGGGTPFIEARLSLDWRKHQS
jgi:hypothetical protein